MVWKDKESGFTLVELAIVLVLIGILIAMVIRGQSLITTAKTKKTAVQVKQLETWAWDFYARYNRFPGDCNGDKVIDVTAVQSVTLDNNPDEGFCSGSANDDPDQPYAELKAAKIAPGRDNDKLARTLLGTGYVYLGKAHYALQGGGNSTDYNAVVVSQCTCIEAKTVDAAIDGELNPGDGRVRVLTADGTFLNDDTKTWDNYCTKETDTVSIVYLFGQTP